MPWSQLKAIAAENRKLKEQEAQEPPAECPIDGTPLEVHPVTKVRHCPLGNFTWEP